MTGAEIAETFAGWLNARRTGVVEWRDDRRRRLFYFESGDLVLAQSNLRSESPQRVAELFPEARDQELRQLLAEHRARGAFVETGGELSTHLGVSAPERQPVDLVRLLWACADALPRPAYQGYPRVRAQGMHWIERLPVPPPIRITLAELDGTRPVEEVVEFASADPEVVRNGLALAVLVGAVDVSAQEAETSQVHSSRPTYRPHSLPAPERPFGDAPRARISMPRLRKQDMDPPSTPEPSALPPSAPQVAPPQVSAPQVAPPQVSAPQVAPPQVLAPQVAPPQVAPPQVAPPQVLAPQVAPPPTAPPRVAPPALLSRQAAGGAAVLAGLFEDEPAPPPVAPPMLTAATHEVTMAARKPTLRATMGASVERILGAKDHFTVLGATWTDPPDALRKQYFQLARELHPDRWSTAVQEDRDAAELLFERVRAAWEVLGADESRQRYIARVIRGEKSEEEKAQERFRLIIEAEGEFKRGLVEFGAGRMLQANELFLRAAGKVPEDQEMRAYAGYTTFRVHAGRNEAKAEEGVAEVQAAIKANERLDQGYVFLGLIQWARGQEGAARNAFIKALRIRPANPDAIRELKRLQRVMDPEDTKRGEGKDQGDDKAGAAGLFSRLFGKKK